jgi:hypothetical protein
VRHEAEHIERVERWIRQAGDGLSSEQLLELFEQAMSALWERTHLTLGTITLTAILDRVLYTAAERFPPFESIKTGEAGIDCTRLRDRINEMSDSQLAEAIRFVVVEFLSVLGNLTAEILTPALHSELEKVRLVNNPARGIRNGGEGKS